MLVASGDVTPRIMRGGYWEQSSWYARSENRNVPGQLTVCEDTGFRVAFTATPKPESRTRNAR
jgi:hypothetical protein